MVKYHDLYGGFFGFHKVLIRINESVSGFSYKDKRNKRWFLYWLSEEIEK